MSPSLTKVIYKPDSQSTDEFTVIVNPEEYKKWKGGDKTIPLTEVVDSFTVFFSNQGSQGILRQPSQQQLDNVFGTHKDDEVVKEILEKGQLQNSVAIASGTGSLNLSRGGASDTGKGRGA